MLRRIASVSCVLFAGLTGFIFAADQNAPEQYFSKLKKLRQNTDHVFSDYYDMHGNACRSLQALMIGRFEFTTNVCAELDSTDPKSLPAYVAALYDVLATVKDPNSIPWLEKRLTGSRRSEIYDHWLSHWRTWLSGVGPQEERWFVRREKWAAFFGRWAEGETQPSRHTEVLRVMQAWLHDARTLEYFTRLEQNSNTSDEDILIAQLYLHQHGRAVDKVKLQETIGRLGKSISGQKVVLEFASEMRHEAFVPSLIDISEGSLEVNYRTAHQNLEAITFCSDVQGRAAWQNWAADHGSESRKTWMEQASSQLFDLAKTNVPAANIFLDQRMYRWNDPIMLTTMERLVEFRPLHSQIVGWINLTYSDYPHLPQFREQLKNMAVRIQKDGEDELEDWAKRLMHSWSFLYEDKTTWEEYVRLSNQRV